MQYFFQAFGLLFPFVLAFYLLKGHKTVSITKFNITVLMVLTATMLLFAAWPHVHKDVMLSIYGYNLDGLSIEEKYLNVDATEVEKVQSLSNSLQGVGWPIPAFYGIMAYVLPYQLLIFILSVIGLTTHRKFSI